jgi:hypothetical protein
MLINGLDPKIFTTTSCGVDHLEKTRFDENNDYKEVQSGKTIFTKIQISSCPGSDLG